MLRRVILVSAVLLLATAITSSSKGIADDKHTGNVPFLPFAADCIDFESDSDCWPFGESRDGDPYVADLELAVGSDPDNEASTPEHGLFDEQALAGTCSDRTDNDLDGRSDGGDPGCRVTCHSFVAGEPCADQDHDGWLRYTEEALGSDPRDSFSAPESTGLPPLSGVCSDGVDNDLDGDIDADDLGCGISDCIDFQDPLPPECSPF